MKRYIFSIVCGFLLSVSGYSAPLTPAEASHRLQSMHSQTSTKINYSSEYIEECVIPDNSETWYAFNRPQGGWVILSADDSAAPVLAYSESGNFDYKRLPEAMKWWLTQYTQEITALRKNATMSSSDEDLVYKAPVANNRQSISPMLTTAWDQNDPFNMLCPEIDGKHTPSGCVAASMAQFMKYYNYPSKGTGKLEYTMNGAKLALDLDTLQLRWEDMLDFYRADATEKQKTSVAQLMQACGYAVESIYGEYATNASVYLWLKALVQNFGYAPSSRLVSRIYMNNEDWDSAIYNSLANGNPVLYSGLGSSGGHAFVCDGYSGDGYYHFNWGWAGLSNGYFLLSALNPTALGTGGGAGGFNIGQIAIVDGKPNFKGSKLTPHMGLLENTQISYSNVSKNFSLTGGGLMNLSAIGLNARPGFEIECPDGSFIYAGEANAPVDFPVTFILTTYARKASVTLADGTYRIRPAFGLDEEGAVKWYRADVPVSTTPYWTLTIAGGKGTMEAHDINSDIVVTDFKATTGIYASTQFKVSASIENKGNREFMSDLYVVIYRPNGTEAATGTANPIDLMPGEKGEFEFTSVTSNVSAGEYSIALAMIDANKMTTDVSQRINVTVLPFQTEVKMQATEFYVDNAQNVNPENITLHVTMTCQKGNYASPIRIWIRPTSVTTGTWGQMLQSEYVYMNEGETKSFTYSFEYPKGEAGVTYTLLSNYVIPESQSWLGSCQFTIASTSGIDTIETVDGESARYYNLQGIEIKNPKKGIYIRVTGNKREKIIL